MKHLISDKLVRLIEKSTDTILNRWQDRLKADPATSSLTEKDLHKFSLKAQMVMKELGKWVGYDTSKKDVGRLESCPALSLTNTTPYRPSTMSCAHPTRRSASTAGMSLPDWASTFRMKAASRRCAT